MRIVRMRSRGWRALRQAAWLGVVVAATAHAKDVTLNLTQPDRFALRGIAVERADGSPLAGVRGIEAYDPDNKTFAFDSPGRGSVKVAAEDLKALTFEQKQERASPMVQSCVVVVTVKKGATANLTVPGDALRIDKGGLVVDDAGLPPLSSPDDKVEVLRLVYDAAADRFTVALQAVRYETAVGGCGSSGAGNQKGLP